MDGPWDSKRWTPSCPTLRLDITNKESQTATFKHSDVVIDLTKSLSKEPFNHSLWILRAIQLDKLGYPDLATGDVWKAAVLIDQRLKITYNLRERLGEADSVPKLTDMIKDQVTTQRGLLTFVSSLLDYRGVMDICDDGIAMYGESFQDFFQSNRKVALEEFSKQDNHINQDDGTKKAYKRLHGERELEMSSKSGATIFTAYPFIPPKYLRRSEDAIESSRKLFSKAGSRCELRKSSIRIGDTTSDVFGVFATRNITSSEVLFEDRTPFACSTVSTSAPSTKMTRFVQGLSLHLCDNCYGNTYSDISPDCCNTKYCSKRCRDLALSSYHKVLCGKDFDWLYEESKHLPKDVALNGPFWLRILAVCVQSGLHPLEHPAIARLTPNYIEACRKWSFQHMIKQPFLILQQLGINPMRDSRYDTWVLHTIWARILNNQGLNDIGDMDGGTLPVRSLSPLYSFINHSCEPNADSKAPIRNPPESCYGGSTRMMHATGDIKKGEEIFISYGTFNGNETKAERTAAIASWLPVGAECGCSRCRREV